MRRLTYETICWFLLLVGVEGYLYITNAGIEAQVVLIVIFIISIVGWRRRSKQYL